MLKIDFKTSFACNIFFRVVTMTIFCVKLNDFMQILKTLKNSVKKIIKIRLLIYKLKMMKYNI